MKLSEAKTAYTFDDMMLVPQYSEIKSRKDPDVSTRLGKINIKIPILSAPMNTVTESVMLNAMAKLGGMGVLHRYMPVDKQIEKILKASCEDYFVAIGATGDYLDRAKRLYDDMGTVNFCIDVANGHSKICVQAVEALRSKIPIANIMAGNVCSYEGAFRLADAGVDIVRSGVGGGCFAGNTRILMSDGSYKDIKDIKIHDRVINKNGQPVQVIGVKFSGFKKVLKYKNNNFYKFSYATPDHEHFVGDYGDIKDIEKRSLREVLNKNDVYGNSRLKWKPLQECSNSVFLMPKNINFDKKEDFVLKLENYAHSRRDFSSGLKEFPVIKPSYELGYIFGTFLGDGCANLSKTTRGEKKHSNTCGSNFWYFSKNETEIATKVCKYIKDIFGLNSKIVETKNMLCVVNRNNSLTRLLKTFGEKQNKHLPDIFYCSNESYIKGLYDGLNDSDGCFLNDERISFSNTSTSLIELYMFLSYKINGQYPSASMRPPRIDGLTNAKLENCKESYYCRTVKNVEWNLLIEHQICKTYNIENTQLIIPTYDIEVDCPTHSFVANNVIVHNSMCKTRVVSGHGVPQLSALEECVRIKENGFDHVSLLADGGIRNSGDIVKALAIGCDAVMIGGLLAGTDETPGQIIEKEFSNRADTGGEYYPNVYIVPEKRKFKKYAGMASQEGRKFNGWFSEEDASFIPEGESTTVPYKGPVKNIIDNLVGGLKVGMSYAGALTIQELQDNAEWVRTTNAGQHESTPYGVKR